MVSSRYICTIVHEAHWYLEEEGCAFVLAFRVHLYLPTAVLDDFLRNSEAHAKAVRVRVLGPLHLAKQGK